MNLVLNGDFSQLVVPGISAAIGPGNQPCGPGCNGMTQEVIGWDSAAANFTTLRGTMNFIFTPDPNSPSGTQADTVGAAFSFNPNFHLWGPGAGGGGVPNGLTNSPLGGDFIASKGDITSNAAIWQTINGLTPGKPATLTFYWAGAQQFPITGENHNSWVVGLCPSSALDTTFGCQTNTQSTGKIPNDSEGFTGWRSQTLSFTPTSSTEVLSFLAVGDPSGLPPVSLLAGVDLQQQVPEPASFILLVVSLVPLLGVCVRMRRRRSDAAASRHRVV